MSYNYYLISKEAKRYVDITIGTEVMQEFLKYVKWACLLDLQYVTEDSYYLMQEKAEEEGESYYEMCRRDGKVVWVEDTFGEPLVIELYRKTTFGCVFIVDDRGAKARQALQQTED